MEERSNSVRRDTVVIGASAGGVETLQRLVGDLPANLPAAILVVMHFPQSSTSVLPAILSRAGCLPALHGVDGEEILPGRIYVAPTGCHMLIRRDRIGLSTGPLENGNRPSIDLLFRTAARERGTRVISAVLSGLLEDGTLGTAAVHRHGGVTMAQDPNDALFGDMPRHAIQLVGTDFVLPLPELAAQIVRLCGSEAADLGEREVRDDETQIAAGELEDRENVGLPSPYVCPECHGTLFELSEEGVPYYCCRAGHSYLASSLEDSQYGSVEAALWTALRTLKEHNAMLERMLKNAELNGFKLMEQKYRERLELGRHRVNVLQGVLKDRSPGERRF